LARRAAFATLMPVFPQSKWAGTKTDLWGGRFFENPNTNCVTKLKQFTVLPASVNHLERKRFKPAVELVE
jgi:hypothetical protein